MFCSGGKGTVTHGNRLRRGKRPLPFGPLGERYCFSEFDRGPHVRSRSPNPMPKLTSAGILAFKIADQGPEVFLVHPGGPFWAKKDAGVWSIPKGEYTAEEDPLEAAKREFREETGLAVEGGIFPLGPVKQPGGKLVTAWACQMEIATELCASNTFSLEWPPKSGRLQEFPEVDRFAWFGLDEAKIKILLGQRPLLDELEAKLKGHLSP